MYMASFLVHKYRMLLNSTVSYAQNSMINPWVSPWNTLYPKMSGQNLLIVVVSDDDDKCEAEITLLLSNWMIAKVCYSQIDYSLVNEILVFILFFDIMVKANTFYLLISKFHVSWRIVEWIKIVLFESIITSLSKNGFYTRRYFSSTYKIRGGR